MDVDEAYALLRVAPGTTGRSLRRAYLKAVRRHPPETDPEGFQRVRAAYELAERYGAFHVPVESPAPGPAEPTLPVEIQPPADEPEAPPPEPEAPTPPPTELETDPIRAALQEIDAGGELEPWRADMLWSLVVDALADGRRAMGVHLARRLRAAEPSWRSPQPGRFNVHLRLMARELGGVASELPSWLARACAEAIRDPDFDVDVALRPHVAEFPFAAVVAADLLASRAPTVSELVDASLRAGADVAPLAEWIDPTSNARPHAWSAFLAVAVIAVIAWRVIVDERPGDEAPRVALPSTPAPEVPRTLAAVRRVECGGARRDAALCQSLLVFESDLATKDCVGARATVVALRADAQRRWQMHPDLAFSIIEAELTTACPATLDDTGGARAPPGVD